MYSSIVTQLSQFLVYCEGNDGSKSTQIFSEGFDHQLIRTTFVCNRYTIRPSYQGITNIEKDTFSKMSSLVFFFSNVISENELFYQSRVLWI